MARGSPPPGGCPAGTERGPLDSGRSGEWRRPGLIRNEGAAAGHRNRLARGPNRRTVRSFDLGVAGGTLGWLRCRLGHDAVDRPRFLCGKGLEDQGPEGNHEKEYSHGLTVARTDGGGQPEIAIVKDLSFSLHGFIRVADSIRRPRPEAMYGIAGALPWTPGTVVGEGRLHRRPGPPGSLSGSHHR